MNRDHTYHVVCRDCPTEQLVQSESVASKLAETHQVESGSEHEVEFARIE